MIYIYHILYDIIKNIGLMVCGFLIYSLINMHACSQRLFQIYKYAERV